MNRMSTSTVVSVPSVDAFRPRWAGSIGTEVSPMFTAFFDISNLVQVREVGEIYQHSIQRQIGEAASVARSHLPLRGWPTAQEDPIRQVQEPITWNRRINTPENVPLSLFFFFWVPSFSRDQEPKCFV